MENFLKSFLIGFTLSSLCFMFGRTVLASGDVQYCYIVQQSSFYDKTTKYIIYGAVDWRLDNPIVYLDSLDQALEMQKKCTNAAAARELKLGVTYE